ncbi:amidohydrolase family protein [Pararobbsia silviterrae]|uniref:Amidohydrolase n=1 Tax=Pararobbsia silviterrae TaxID=1792498 RepID=A0A494Y5I9_9BURK|nr:amidohydrolase family protein [Pararobbsia silviterrae]RKP57901.1 amidohydrolase [Pararobbsia silviterrae]
MNPPLSLATYTAIDRARLPRWLLPDAWPTTLGEPALATIEIADARVHAVTPYSDTSPAGSARRLDLGGALVLPGLFEPHAHIDKAYTRSRMGRIVPGLLGAIDAAAHDRERQNADDIRARAYRALLDAERAGVTRLRTHIDWPDASAPLAWHVIGELAELWRDRVHVERIALVPLPRFAWRDRANAIARTVAASRDAWLGGFIHTSNFDARALEQLIDAASHADVGLDLHVDEELSTQARGLSDIAALAREMRPARPIVCSHVCALAARPERDALVVLDRVADAPITLVSLPRTNLLLQDAETGRTPRLRGITLIAEAQARAIPVLIGTDNVQDAFCAYGTHDPIDALRLAAIAAQLDDVFDRWSASICRTDWIDRADRGPASLIDRRADFTVFEDTDAHIWPEAARRSMLRAHGIARATVH